MRISNYNKQLNKILSPDVIYKAEMKHTTWKRSGWDNDIEEYKFTIEAKSEHELNTMIEKYLNKNGLYKESYMKDLKTLCKHELTEIELEEYNLIKRNINNEINNKF